MSDPTEEVQAEAAEIDPTQMSFLEQRLRSEQNLPLGALAGVAASLAGAGAWAAITAVSGYQIGFMAIGVGVLVGYAIRVVGNGIDPIFGVVGAVLALFGCVLGNLLAVTAIVADSEGMPFLDVLLALDADLARELMGAWFTPMDLLFYGIAAYAGYRYAFRQIAPEDVDRMLGGGAPPAS